MVTEIDVPTANDLLAKLDALENEARSAGLLDAEMWSSICILHCYLRRSAEGRNESERRHSPNYTYVECERCNRRGTPKCRRKGERWGLCVIPGCMELVEDAPKYLKTGDGDA